MPQPLINITKKQAFMFAIFLVMYEFLTYIANDMIMPAMIHVVNAFQTSEKYIATSLSLYVLGGASLQIFLGPISDKCGRRPVMIFGVFFFFICTFFIALSQTIDQFLILRFFEGMGLCFISVVGYAVIQEIFAEMDAVRVVAIMTNIAVIAPLLGPLAGAYLANSLSWHYVFLIISALTVVSLVGLWCYMPETIGQVKHDGVEIKRMDLNFATICKNYKSMVTNLRFMLISISFGFLGITCVAWIALAPIMLVTDAKLSLIQYALWQIPIFTVFILANLILIKLTYSFSLIRLSFWGGYIATLGLFILFVLPLCLGNNYIWVIPGIVIYFFGFGLAASPLYRLVLYSTDISKGTAAALHSLIYMSIQGLGIECANLIFSSHNNIYFGAFSALTGMIFIFLMCCNKYFIKGELDKQIALNN